MESFCDLVNLENVEFLDKKQIGEDTRLRLLIGCPRILDYQGFPDSGQNIKSDGHPSFAISSIEELWSVKLNSRLCSTNQHSNTGYVRFSFIEILDPLPVYKTNRKLIKKHS